MTIRNLLTLLFVLAIIRCIAKIYFLGSALPKINVTRSRTDVAISLCVQLSYAALLLYIIITF